MSRPIRLAVLAGAVAWLSAALTAQPARFVQFVFTSDVHYGLTRPAFRGDTAVNARVVNAAQVRSINALPAAIYPKDGGLRGGEGVGTIDFLAEGGDIANRSEGTPGSQPSAVSWKEFTHDYIDGLTLTDAGGARIPVLIVPGNHDTSNAIGFHRPLTPPIDATAYVGIYNWMVRPATPVTTATFDAARHRVLTSRDIGGLHLQFVPVWPDSSVRRWMAEDLRRVRPDTPVIVFAHDEPSLEAKHLRNPNGAHDINPKDRFENLVLDMPARVRTINEVPVEEHRALERFLAANPRITAYFHGDANYTQFYDWTGPGGTALIHVVRVDSPMKGEFSLLDETRLAFNVAVVDLSTRMMTVREALWNTTRGADAPAVRWGMSTTVALRPRPRPRD